MIAGEQDISDYFTSVTILFADIAGFTPISAGMPAYVVVRFLNYVFGTFDAIMKKHGCEKIKTIGDGYMAVAGAPIPCDDHAERMAFAALEMQQDIRLPEEFKEYMPEGVDFGIRVGLHTGSVVGGVIGDERFVYDIYSDAVNTAARMESHGEPDKIHVSHEYYIHLQNRFAMTKNTTHGITFEKRGEMDIKGKGLMKTYYLQKANL
jgi:class 3 adenylate cyclase